MARKKKQSKEEPINPDEVMEVWHGVKETVRLEEARGCRFTDTKFGNPAIRITPLEILKINKQITPEQYGAGEVYGRLYKMAHFVGKYPSSLGRWQQASPEIGMAAMFAVVRAQKAIGSVFLIQQADQVCGCDKTPTDFLKLKEALFSLQTYYDGHRRNRKSA